VTTPAITFPDAQLATRNLLRDIFAAEVDPTVPEVTVSTRDLPGSDNDRPMPYVRVRLDGTDRDSQLNGTADLRITVWNTDEGLALWLAGYCEARLLASSGRGVRNFGAGLGPTPTTDIDTGLPIAFFTITARLSPTQLGELSI